MEDTYIKRAWTNYGQPSALKALHGFVKARGIKDIKNTEKKLSKIHAFSVHKPARRKYPTRSMVLKGPRENFCADLVDVQAYSRQNKGFKWMLFVLDGFTKELFVMPIKQKTTRQVADAFQSVIKQAKRPPAFTFTDMGLEFTGSAFQEVMKKYNIQHYVSRTKRKSFMCERVIKTIKTLLAKYYTQEGTKRWVDVIQKIVTAYNKTPHSAHGYKPSEIKAKDVDEIIHRLYAKFAKSPHFEGKYKIGDHVRIAKNRLTFQKGYEKSFTDQVFRVSSYVQGSFPVPSYKLETLDGEPISSSFVDSELGYAEPDS